MLREKFKTWSTDPIIEETLVKLDLHISTLGYLEKGSPCFVGLLNGGIEKNRQKIELDTAAAIPNNNQQLNLLDLNDLKAKWAKKEKEKI